VNGSDNPGKGGRVDRRQCKTISIAEDGPSEDLIQCAHFVTFLMDGVGDRECKEETFLYTHFFTSSARQQDFLNKK
jgi:hypothetical protein